MLTILSLIDWYAHGEQYSGDQLGIGRSTFCRVSQKGKQHDTTQFD